MNKDKHIEKIARVMCGGCANGNGCLHTLCADWYNAEKLYNAGYRKQGEWISVEDRLPEAKINCLVHYKHAYCDDDGYYAIGVSFYDGNEFQIGLAYKVTHWMPLPQPPTEEENSHET